MILDKTMVEGYIDGGKLMVAEALKPAISDRGLEFRGDLKIHQLEIDELNSIWDTALDR